MMYADMAYKIATDAGLQRIYENISRESRDGAYQMRWYANLQPYEIQNLESYGYTVLEFIYKRVEHVPFMGEAKFADSTGYLISWA